MTRIKGIRFSTAGKSNVILYFFAIKTLTFKSFSYICTVKGPSHNCALTKATLKNH